MPCQGARAEPGPRVFVPLAAAHSPPAGCAPRLEGGRGIKGGSELDAARGGGRRAAGTRDGRAAATGHRAPYIARSARSPARGRAGAAAPGAPARGTRWVTRVLFVLASRERGAAQGDRGCGRAEPALARPTPAQLGPWRSDRCGPGVAGGVPGWGPAGSVLRAPPWHCPAPRWPQNCGRPLGTLGSPAASLARAPVSCAASLGPGGRARWHTGASFEWGAARRPRTTKSREGERPGRGEAAGRSAWPEWAECRGSCALHIRRRMTAAAAFLAGSLPLLRDVRGSSLRGSPLHPPAEAPHVPCTILGAQLCWLVQTWRLRVTGRKRLLVR